MSQYIQVATPVEKTYQSNSALTEILIFLGKKYKEKHHGFYVQMRRDYSVGLDFIAKKCGKGYKTTIRNLNYSKRELTMFHTSYRNWKFHKTKAMKFFKKLYYVLKAFNTDDAVWVLFDQLYNEISSSLYIEKRGSHVISCPYHSALNQARNDNRYSYAERESIARITHSFSTYDKLYYVEESI